MSRSWTNEERSRIICWTETRLFRVLQILSGAVIAFGVIGLIAAALFGGNMTGAQFDKVMSIFGYILGGGAAAFWLLFVASIIAEERKAKK